MDPIVLSFHDSLLRESDVQLLDGSKWLNDKIIGFYFEYLEYVVFKELSDKVCFVTPDVTQFVKLYEGPELEMFLEPLNLHLRELVILAVNNNAQSDQPGGSHWSTLAYSRKENAFLHLDSWSPTNSRSARRCAQRVTPFLKASTPPQFSEMTCSHQDNCYDCGVYALYFAETVCRMKLQAVAAESTLVEGDTSTMDKWRKDTKKLIHALAAKPDSES